MPLARIATLKDAFISNAFSTIPSSLHPLKVLIAHATPSLMCSSAQFAQHECVQVSIYTFENRSAAPYLFDASSGTFDVVVLRGVLDNALDVSRVIFEVQRVLKPCGKLIFDATSRNLATWLHLVTFERILRLEPWSHRNWRLFVDPEEMMRVLTAYNFSSFKTVSFSSFVSLSRLLAGNPILDSISVESTDGDGHEYCVQALNRGCDSAYRFPASV